MRARSTVSLFAAYAAGSLVLVVLLGLVLSASYRAEAERRGVAAGVSEARLLASAGVVPLLDGRRLDADLPTATRASLDRLTRSLTESGAVLRLRLRDLDGRVVYSLDGSGTKDAPDDEAVEAGEGEEVAVLTRLNTDSVDTGAAGVEAVEVYLPLRAGEPERTVGVIEAYLPYAPIDADVSAGMAGLYRDLGLGLALLYVGVFALAMSMSRGLRRQLRVNRHLAEHDGLTDLPNRGAFRDRVHDELLAARGTGRRAVVAVIDLDRFKEVNDALGHDSGDLLLTEIARRLAGHVRDGDTVARLGGDEFGVVLRDAADPDRTLWRLREVIEEETTLLGVPVSVASSLGYVVLPDDGDDAELLLRRADVAMYTAKARHSGVARYEAAQDHYDVGNLTLMGEFRRAVERDELVVHYQPQVGAADRGAISVEALVRWQHPTRGLLGPDQFVPLLEQTDLIDVLTAWVLDRALADLALIDERAVVSVNISARSLSRPDIVSLVRDSLARTGADPRRLVLEITETALLVDPDRAATVLLALTDLGVRVSLDDFGVGQTSLSHLAALPIHELKIDRVFVSDLLVNPTHAAIARSIAELGRSLGLRVVAEGVETEEVADAVSRLGASVLQGYLVARPMPVDSARAWWREQRPARAAAVAD